MIAAAPDEIDVVIAKYHELLSTMKKCKCELVRKKKQLQPEIASSSQVTKSTSNKVHIVNQVRLPKLELPKFNGNPTEWMPFRDLYLASVHNNQLLSDAQKLSYLQTSLTSHASKIIHSIPITDSNYKIAWDLLKCRFDNRRELYFTILRKFINHLCVNPENARSLRSLIDATRECARSLEAIDIKTENFQAVIMFHAVEKLDNSARQLWEMSLLDTSIPDLEDVIKFLEQRSRSLAAIGSKIQPSVHKLSRLTSGEMVASSPSHAESSKNVALFCKFCNQNHLHVRCHKFTAMTVSERRDEVKKQKLCFNCLKEGHTSNQCKNEKTCNQCKQKHHSMLHYESSNLNHIQSSHATIHARANQVSQTLLATALINVKSSDELLTPCKALLDSGATHSFVTESLVQKLGLQRKFSNAEVVGLGSSSVTRTRGIVTVTLQPHFQSKHNFQITFDAYIINKATSNLPLYPCEKTWNHLSKIQLADPSYNIPSPIDMVIGEDIFWDLILAGQRKGPLPSPIAQRSKLGWLIQGKTSSPTTSIQVNHSTLDESLQRFWEIESIIVLPPRTDEEVNCESHFISTYQRPDGKYEVQIPFKDNPLTLGESRRMALSRFFQMEKKLSNNRKLKNLYCQFMDEYESLGHMKPAELSQGSCFIPHHPVLKDYTYAEKFRVVFNASAKTTSGKSLNDLQMIGPTVQDGLHRISTRFRIYPIAITADVSKMYRQIRVAKEHQKYQSILWRSKSSEPVKEYQLTTVTYGTSSAPFMTQRVLQQLSIDESQEYPTASKIALRDFYMDDLESGGETEEETRQLVKEFINLLNAGGMPLRKWASNRQTVIQHLPDELRSRNQIVSLDNDHGIVNSLGLCWNTKNDTFVFRIKLPPSPQSMTRRMLISQISQIFDPQCWLAPIIIRLKILAQQIWKIGTGWDDVLPSTIIQKWLKFKNNLSIQSIQINRCIKPYNSSKFQLHGFSDASEQAYGAVVYLKVTQSNHTFLVSIVSSKTKVAPLQTVSLPRLELCGALLLAQLIDEVKKSLNLELEFTRAWTDSTITLSWIRSSPHCWNQFVGNRVSKIQELIKPSDWFHISGQENPADCISRGIDPLDLPNHSLWWTGPPWLSTSCLFTEPNINTDEEITIEKERKKIKLAHNPNQTDENSCVVSTIHQ